MEAPLKGAPPQLLGLGGSIHPAQREQHLPTLTLEKLVPGGMAEVSPWR